MEGLEEKEEKLYREVIEAANYVSELSMMHYGGKFQTVDLILNNQQAKRRLDSSLNRIKDVKQALEDQLQDLELTTVETGSSPRYVEKAKERAEETLDELEGEINHITEARKVPPEQDADQEYVSAKEKEAETLAEGLEYNPKRSEKS